ncbi:Histidine kinase-, DNA gyrase B-, and HSP90-like ATPase [Geodermatophilus pulveris]|uniref:Histidine kinase-, DNA gyrase B-, and HSP90-like ATPase n=1 Tax=Geodermatophilus pulveris TaxID=1564159 RepID=A0A239E0L4_9ACTN|nr:GAF domain-containing sensor histidine kinase [Geodermatophilus pulveris]SNS38260.1 Histidine kinase-, DNA gyrase B-, and HSP90-like ATPase [Geodermatophilus pulveris]
MVPVGSAADIHATTSAWHDDWPAVGGFDDLVRMVDGLSQGVALLTPDLHVLHVNPAGWALGDAGHEALPGPAAPHRTAVITVPARGVHSARGSGRREVEYSDVPLDVQGQRLVVRAFRDVTEERRAVRWQATLTHLAAQVALAESLEATLDTVAACLLEATEMTGCAAIVFDGEPARLRVAGTAGLPADYADRFRRALADGKEALPSVAAFRNQQTVVVDRAREDPVLRWLEDLDGDLDWRSIASFPMVARNHPVGAVKTFWPGPPPDGDELRFLAAVADQAATAVDNARLYADAAASSRRDEGLIAAGLALASELSLPAVLTKIVELACDVADARYGAVGVLGRDGRLEDFITHGLTEDQRAAIGALPIGRGILGALTSDARPLRLGSIQNDPRSVGFPPHHPPMTSFLGVPITVRGRIYGNLYLTEKRGPSGFTDGDERAVVTLAAQAGVAIENARLFAEAQQRLALQARHRLARELHDSVSQALFSMTLETRGAQLLLERAGLPPEGPLGERLGNLRALTQGALAEMRALIFELRPEALREEGLAAAIRKQAEGVSARTEIRVEVRAPKRPIPLPGDVEEQVYRLVQEALANVAKHSGARSAVVQLRRRNSGQELLVDVTDDGVGFDASTPQPGHLGLRTMAQRMEQLGGSLVVDTGPGRGTRVSAVIPLTTPGSTLAVPATSPVSDAR